MTRAALDPDPRVGPRLVGICGLNRDPYTQSTEVGRVRHLYVDPDFRRRGIGQLLVSKIVECASKSFSRARLRTLRADAAQFYMALGFRTVVAEPDVTHEMDALCVTTPFVSPRDFLQAQCVDRDVYTYLELSTMNGGMGTLPTDVSADIRASRGLHLIDVHIAMGNLVDLAAKQAAALH